MNETPKQLPKNIHPGIVILDNAKAIEQASEYCRQRFPQMKMISTLTTRLDGEAQTMGRFLAKVGKDGSFLSPWILFVGGETTVTISPKQKGVGGRNQELALSAAIQFFEDKSNEELSLLAFGTDGQDGPTSAAGAIVDGNTLKGPGLYQKAKIALEQHDSFSFFQKYCPLNHIVIGPTGTNVMDVVILMKSSKL